MRDDFFEAWEREIKIQAEVAKRLQDSILTVKEMTLRMQTLQADTPPIIQEQI